MYRICWSKAIADVFKGRVEVIEESDVRFIGTVTGSFPMPIIVRFCEGVFIDKWRNKTRYVRLTRKNIWLRDKGACQYCGTDVTINSYEIEHVTPKSQGGMTAWKNVVTSCKKCNQKKGAKTPLEAGMFLLATPKKPKLSDIFGLVSNK
jgi:5-methylcytosine-specific restriction endonuclease McrA